MKGEYLVLLLEFLEEFINSKLYQNRYIVIFGANAPGTIIINQLEQYGINVSSVIDNNEKSHGKLFMDIMIEDPEQVLGSFRDDALILISSRYYEEMKKQLELMGYEENRHIVKTIELSNSIKFSLTDETFNLAISNIERGLQVYNRIQEKHNAKLIIMVPVRPNGDVYIICSYIRAFAKKLNVPLNNLVLTVIGSACYKVAELFNLPNVEKLTWDDSDCLATLGHIWNDEIRIMNPYFSHLSKFPNIEGYKGINFVDDIKLGLMDLEEKAIPYYPEQHISAREIDKFFEENGLRKNKTVILAPYANSIPQIRWEFWEKLVEELLSLDFDVCTNCGTSNEKPLAGTKSIFFEFKDAVDICNNAGYVIAYRSGFCDIIANSKCKRIVIYPDHTTGLSGLHEVFEMKDPIYNQYNLFELVHSYEKTENLIKKVIDTIKQ